jgi:hypothetical protein
MTAAWSNARNPVCNACYARRYYALHGPRSIAPSSCTTCGKSITQWRILNGRRVCRPCYSHALPDQRCGLCSRLDKLVLRYQGTPCCNVCYVRIRNQGVCGRCGSQSIVYGRQGAKRCQQCRKAEGWKPPAGTIDVRTTCSECGEVHGGRPGSRCRRCLLDRELRSLLGDARGEIPDVLMPFYHYMRERFSERKIDWVRRLPPLFREYFAGVAAGAVELSERTVCELASGVSTRDILSRLIGAGVFKQARIEDVQTEAWLRKTILPRLDAHSGGILLQYFRFHAVPESLARSRGRMHSSAKMEGFRHVARSAGQFLRCLADRDETLAHCPQRLVDGYCATISVSQRAGLAPFLNWARRNALCAVTLTAHPATERLRTLADEEMLERLRRIDDESIPRKLRLAATLLWLHGIHLATTVSLRGLNIDDSGGKTLLLLQTGAQILLLDPLRALLLAERPARPSDWIFPSKRYPEQHIGPQTLKRALRRAGLLPFPAAQVSVTAKRRLLALVPACLAREVLGINSSSAVKAVATMASPSAQRYVSLRVRAANQDAKSHLEPQR